MSALIIDPTAGERARRIRANPRAAERISDPTDPRYGELAIDVAKPAIGETRLVDPNNPEYFERSR